MSQQIRRRRISVYAMPYVPAERRAPNENDREFQESRVSWRMSPPPDGPALTPAQIERCVSGITRALSRGCWSLAVRCVERSREGLAFHATDEQLDRFSDGPRLASEVAAMLARTAEIWLRAGSTETAATAIRRRKTDTAFLGDSITSNSMVVDLHLAPRLTASIEAHCGATCGDAANKLETWAKYPSAMPVQLQNTWHEVASALLNAGLLQSLATARLKAAGRNSKARKEKA